MFKHLLAIFYIIAAIASSSCGIEPTHHYEPKVGGDNEILGDDLINRYTVKLNVLMKSAAQGVVVGTCSGTLLSRQFVLTAAHCVTANPWRIKVAVGGDHPIKLPNGRTYSETMEVESAIFPSKYNDNARKIGKRVLFRKFRILPIPHQLQDIAVMKLKQPLNLPYKIDFTIPKTRHNLRGRQAMIAGYGVGDMGQVPRRGRQAVVTIADDFYDLLQFNNFFNRMNFGDSGGPVWLAKGDKLELIGVNSFMIWVLRLRAYSIDIRHHRKWIYDAIEVLKSSYQKPLTKKQNMHRLIMTGVAEDAFISKGVSQ